MSVTPSGPAGWGGRLLPAGVNVVGAAAAISIAAMLAGVLSSGQAESVSAMVGIIILLLTLVLDASWGLLLWVVLAPFYRFFILDVGAGLPAVGLHRIVAVFLLVLLIAQTAAGRRKLARFTAVEGLAALFVVGLLLSVPASHLGILNGIQNVFDFVVLPVLWFYFARRILGNKQQLDRLTVVLAIAGATMGLIAAREQLTHQVLLSPITDIQTYGRYSIKINSLFGATSSMTMTLVMTAPAALVGAMRAKTPWHRLAWSAALVVILGGLVLTYQRAGWIAALLCLVVPIFLSRRARHYALRLAPILLILILIFANGAVDTRSFGERVQSKNPIDYRFQALEVGLRIVAGSPVLGLGLDNYSDAALAYGWRPLATGWLPSGAAHNMFIYVLTSAGLVGLLPLLGLLGLIGWRALCFLRTSRDRDWPAAVLGLLLGYAGITFTFDGLSAQLANMYFFMFVGAVFGAYEAREDRGLASEGVS